MKRLVMVGAVLAAILGAVAVVDYLGRDGRYRARLAEGERRLAARDSYGAIEEFSGAIALRPESMPAYFRRAEAYRNEDRDDEAIRDLKEAIRLAPDATQPLIMLGDLYDARGEPALAAVRYEQAAAFLRDQDPGLLYKLALAHYRAGAPKAAIAPLLAAIGRNDSDGAAHYLLGVVYRDTQQLELAATSLKNAIRMAPDLLAAREELADLYRQQGRAADEIAQLQALARADPQVHRIVALALAESRLAQFDAALGTLRQAVNDAPDDPQVQLAVARVHLARVERTGDHAAIGLAHAVLEKALGGSAPRSEGLALLGRTLYWSGEYGAAETVLREAVATSPIAPEAFLYLADASAKLGHYLDARDALLSLDALEGDSVSAVVRATRAVRLGAFSLSANDARSAAHYLNLAVEGGRRDAATYRLLAQARWQALDPVGARDALDKALALDPHNPDLIRLKRTFK